MATIKVESFLGYRTVTEPRQECVWGKREIPVPFYRQNRDGGWLSCFTADGKEIIVWTNPGRDPLVETRIAINIEKHYDLPKRQHITAKKFHAEYNKAVEAMNESLALC